MQNPRINGFVLSGHALARMRQRGLTQKDLDLVMTWGEGVDDGYVVTNKILKACQWTAGDDVKRLEQLKGVTVIAVDGVLVTAFRADKRRIRRLRRGPVKQTGVHGRHNLQLH